MIFLIKFLRMMLNNVRWYREFFLHKPMNQTKHNMNLFQILISLIIKIFVPTLTTNASSKTKRDNLYHSSKTILLKLSHSSSTTSIKIGFNFNIILISTIAVIHHQISLVVQHHTNLHTRIMNLASMTTEE
jgi:hypothetical protein